MKALRLVSVFAILATAYSKVLVENDIVRFDVIASRSIEVPPTIEVTLNGVKDKLELTHYRMNDVSAVDCNYLGYLRNSPSSSVAVTGCLNKPGDRMEVTMISEKSVNKMFTVDFNGNAEVIKSPFEDGALSVAIQIPKITLANRNFDDQEGDEILDDQEEEQVATAKLSSIPSKLKATIRFGYEDGLKSELFEDFDSWAATQFTHTQAHFRHAASLGTTIEFEVKGPGYYQQGSTWYSDTDIPKAAAATKALNLKGVDVMSWWCKKGGNHGGIVGSSYTGGLCMTAGYNTNINENLKSAAANGFLLAHELGHSFGMNHDDNPKNDGKNCKGVMLAIVNHIQNAHKWSTCSRSDWEHHYSKKNWGQDCLEDISVCRDSGDYSHERCQAWKGANYCGNADWEQFMEDHCKKSCGLCTDSDGLRNEGKECWTASCNGQGPCAFCGNGLCCKKNFHDTTKGCDGSIGGDGKHQCVAKPEE